MILALFAAETLPPEQAGFGNTAAGAADGIAPLLDRLGARLGLGAIARIEPHASHIPERASVYAMVSESHLPLAPGGGESRGEVGDSRAPADTHLTLRA